MRKTMKQKLFGAMAILVGLVFMGFLFSDWRESRTIEKEGVEAAVDTPTSYKRIKKRFGDRYGVELKFTSPSGAKLGAYRPVSRGVIDQFEASKVVKVKYMPGDVSRLRVIGDTDAENWIGAAVGIFFLVVGVVLLRGRKEEIRSWRGRQTSKLVFNGLSEASTGAPPEVFIAQTARHY
jgi:hypothetical protein